MITDSLENIEVSVKESVESVKKLTINDILNHFQIDDKIKEYSEKMKDKVGNIELGSTLLQLIVKNCPNSAKEINQALEDALSDGVLDPIDVPPLMVVFTRVYKTEIKRFFKGLKDAKQTVVYTFSDFVTLLTFLIEVLCFFDIVKIANKEKFHKSLKASLDLLDMMVDEDGFGCCPCF